MEKIDIDKIEKELDQVGREENLSSEHKRLFDLFKNYEGDDRIIRFKDLQKEIAEREESAPGIETNITKLDHLTEGFRPGNLITVSGLSGHGKTSVLQSFLMEFAQQEIGSVFFTYEVQPEDFLEKFGKNIPNFSYIPRQHKKSKIQWLEERIIESIAKYNIKVVMIDHLHYLLDMQDVGKFGNTSLLIGSIMRKLKEIALQYNLVIFLVAHTKKVKMLSGEKLDMDAIRDCLPKRQLIYSDGKRIPVEKIKKGTKVVSKGTSLRLQNDLVKHQWQVGKKEIYRLITRTGCQIECSGGQKFLATTFAKKKGVFGPRQGKGIAGWKKLENLAIGQKIAIVKKYPKVIKETITSEMALILGWVIGDGHIAPKGHTEISIERKDECQLLKNFADKAFNLDCLFKKCEGKNAYRFYLTKRKGKGKNNWVEWIRKLKFTPIGKDKFVPLIIFEQSEKIVGAFLSGLFQADSSVSNSGLKKSPCIRLETISKRLAYDTHHLLKRLGIVAWKRKQSLKSSGFRTKNGFIYQIRISGLGIRKFKEKVGLYCFKKKKLDKISQSFIPRAKTKKTDLFFDRIKSIEYLGIKETYDIEIVGHHKSLPNHTYCVNDILTHNSSFCVQESDFVFFIDRGKEIREGDTEAVLAIVKNRRNGKLGRIELTYEDNQFKEVDKEHEDYGSVY